MMTQPAPYRPNKLPSKLNLKTARRQVNRIIKPRCGPTSQIIKVKKLFNQRNFGRMSIESVLLRYRLLKSTSVQFSCSCLWRLFLVINLVFQSVLISARYCHSISLGSLEDFDILDSTLQVVICKFALRFK
jgi:hypothetical protein